MTKEGWYEVNTSPIAASSSNFNSPAAPKSDSGRKSGGIASKKLSKTGPMNDKSITQLYARIKLISTGGN